MGRFRSDVCRKLQKSQKYLHKRRRKYVKKGLKIHIHFSKERSGENHPAVH